MKGQPRAAVGEVETREFLDPSDPVVERGAVDMKRISCVRAGAAMVEVGLNRGRELAVGVDLEEAPQLVRKRSAVEPAGGIRRREA